MGKYIKGVNDLQTLYPSIAKLWHPTLNGRLTPSDVSAGSKQRVFWMCEKGHTWQTMVSTITANKKKGSKSSGCPYCDNKKVIAGFNDLESKYPEIAKEWDWEKNRNTGKTPSSITAYTDKKYYWKGTCGHSWYARVSDRTQKNAGCNICAQNILHSGENDLETVALALCSQWDLEKNIISPKYVSANTHDMYWWKCELGHEWQNSPNRRVQAYRKTQYVSCPICAKSSHTSFPEKAIYYYCKKIFEDVRENYTIDKNKELDIFIESKNIGIEYDGAAFHRGKKDVVDSSKDKWCKNNGIKLFRLREIGCGILPNNGQTVVEINTNPNDQELKEGITNLLIAIEEYLNITINCLDIDIQRDKETIISLQKLFLKKNSLYEIRPELLKEWDYDKNSKIGIFPKGISAYSCLSVYWKCEKGHSWKASPNSRISTKSKCPYCIGRRVQKGENDLATLFPQLVEEWDYDKNILKPEEVLAYSKKRVHWVCKKDATHQWESVINYRTKQGAGCPYCSNNALKPGFNDLETRYPKVAKEWDYSKNAKNPCDYFPSSNENVWWIGPCGHSWDMPIALRTGKKPQGCPICAGRRVLAGFNDFPSQNPVAFKEWDWIKNKIDPYTLTVGSSRQAFWICSKNPEHKWKTSVAARKKSGCPFCCGNKILAGVNDFKTAFPSIAKEWDYSKNKDLLPENCSPFSRIKVWWKGMCGHSWYQAIGLRTGSQKQGCPYCAGRKVLLGVNDLETLYPEIIKYWDTQKNGELKPSDYLPGSHKKVWWINDDGSEEYRAIRNKVKSIKNRNKS